MAEMKIALAGNPNCGKTTLFNALTGSNQFVGNWPGVTVEKKEGKLKKSDDIIVVDLPGIYSLSPYTMEEVVARNFLVGERPDVILNIVDGTNLERNLYLTTQLIELGIPVVIAINMMDIVNRQGDKIDIEKLSRVLGCKIVEISALKETGLTEAADAAIVAAQRARVAHQPFFSGIVEHAIAHIEEAAVHNMPAAQQRWYAIKIFERDPKVLEQLKLDKRILEHIENDIKAVERSMEDDAEGIIINERYEYVTDVVSRCYTKKNKGRLSTSDKIDRVVTNRVLALPIFAVIMFLVYYISVSTVGTWATDWANDGLFGDGWHLFGMGTAQYETAVNDYAADNIWTDEIIADIDLAAKNGVTGADEIRNAIAEEDFGAFEEAYGSYGVLLPEDTVSAIDTVLSSEDIPQTDDYGIWVPGVPVLIEGALPANCPVWLHSLIIDGIVGGVGAVLGFLPQMLMLFLMLAFLEACGYMSRIAFVMDRIFRKFGLSGKSFIPILIGTGCGVPGIMASRTIENENDRRMTVITTTFIPCGAKLPIIALIAAALFDGAWWVAPSAYFIGIAAIVLSGIMLKKTKLFSGETAPFVMELPAYHMPTFINVLRSMWERGWSFIKKAGTIILLSTIIIWAGSRFGMVNGSFGFDVDMELSSSLLGMLGNLVAWIFAPLGFGTAQASVATLMGLLAKEEVVAVFGVLQFDGMSALAGYSFLVFNLLCAPCFAAIGAIRREMNSAKWTLFAISYQCVFAYAVSLMIYQIGSAYVGTVNPMGLIAAFLVMALMLFMIFRPARGKKYELDR